jgi:AcrR family transcriptional regulator
LKVGEALFRERGYNGFSYQDISRPLGIRNAAVHYHFPSKGDLGVAIVERYRRLVGRLARHPATTGEQAVAQLQQLFRFELAQASSHGRPLVCPLAVLATDYANISAEMRDSGGKLVEEMRSWLSHVLEVGRREGAIRFPGEPQQKAVTILATFLGTRQLARLGGFPAVQQAVEQIAKDLGLAA